jgi:hypothetical protein
MKHDHHVRLSPLGALTGALLLFALAAIPHASFAAQSNDATTIRGFRGAEFGMTESQLRATIPSNLGVSASAIHASENPVQKTAVITVKAPNLLPDGGAADVSYVFGYRSHKLIEINILWSKATDPKITLAQLEHNGVELQTYFRGEGFPPDRTAANLAVPGGLLLFRTNDKAGHAIVLVLAGTVTKDAKSDKATLVPTSLSLAYAANPEHPDVFELKHGSF